MKVTKLEEFREQLLATGSYVTADDHRAPKRRKPSRWTTFRFSWFVASVFPKCAIYEPLGLLNTDRWAHFCWRAAQEIEKSGMTLTCDGWNNRRDYKGPVVYLCNHISTLETILTPPVLLAYGPFNVVVKASLSHLPFLEAAAAHMGLIPLGRKSPREDLMKMFSVGKERIEQGNSILIFAQGSREKVFARKGWSSIGAKLAEKAGVPVIPIAVRTDCLPTRDGGGMFKDFGTVDTSKDVRMRCGPVITGTAKEMHQKSFDWIAEQLREWQMPVED